MKKNHFMLIIIKRKQVITGCNFVEVASVFYMVE